MIALACCGAVPAAAVQLFALLPETRTIVRFSPSGTPMGTFAAWNSPGTPDDFAFGPDGRVYVLDSGRGIFRLDERSGAFVDIFVPPSPHLTIHSNAIAWGPDGHLYVANGWLKDVQRFHGTTGAYLGVFIPPVSIGLDAVIGDMTFGPDGNLYLTINDWGHGQSAIRRYRGSDGAYLGMVVAPVAGWSHDNLVFSPNGSLYTTTWNDNRVGRFDAVTGAALGTVKPKRNAIGPVDLVIGPTGDLYVSYVSDDGGLAFWVERFSGVTNAAQGDFVSPSSQPIGALAFGPCTTGNGSLCLAASRFRVTARWRTADNRTGLGVPIQLTDDSGYFWFFGPGNVELVVKVLDACSFNQAYWVFAAGLTNVSVTVTVTDTVTGQVRTYQNPQGTLFEAVSDTAAFHTCNLPG